MKAIRVADFGGPEVLRVEDVPEPQPGPNQIVVRLHAAGVNPVETYQRAGTQGYARERPFTPGADGAGVVKRIGSEVSGFSAGDRVYVAGSLTGTYAEQCLCTADQVHHLPAPLSFEQGACLWINYGTAYRALFQRGGAVAGETVLVHGATGGVGIAAAQWALHRGLRTLATYGSDEGLRVLEAQGVHELFDHHDERRMDALLQATNGRGVDLIVEMLANVNLERDLDALAPNGRVVIVGSRGTIEVTPRKLMGREADVRGLMLAAASEAEQREIHDAIGSAAVTGALRPVVQRTLSLAEAPEAHRAVIEDPSHGKIVLVP